MTWPIIIPAIKATMGLSETKSLTVKLTDASLPPIHAANTEYDSMNAVTVNKTTLVVAGQFINKLLAGKFYIFNN